jgi:flagellar biosynthesis/type III secretory pathway chaperone
MMTEINGSGYREILDKTVMTLRQLSGELQQGCAMLAAMDLDGIYQRIANQESLIQTLLALEQERKSWEKKVAHPGRSVGPPRAKAPSTDPTRNDRIRDQIEDAQAEVRRWNGVYGILLARSRQSVGALANAMGCLSVAGMPPSAQAETVASVSSRT